MMVASGVEVASAWVPFPTSSGGASFLMFHSQKYNERANAFLEGGGATSIHSLFWWKDVPFVTCAGWSNFISDQIRKRKMTVTIATATRPLKITYLLWLLTNLEQQHNSLIFAGSYVFLWPFPRSAPFRLPQLTHACCLHRRSLSSPSSPKQPPPPPASGAGPGPAGSGGSACRSLSPSRCRSSSGLRQNLTDRRWSRSALFLLLSLLPSSPSFPKIEKRKKTIYNLLFSRKKRSDRGKNRDSWRSQKKTFVSVFNISSEFLMVLTGELPL